MRVSAENRKHVLHNAYTYAICHNRCGDVHDIKHFATSMCGEMRKFNNVSVLVPDELSDVSSKFSFLYSILFPCPTNERTPLLQCGINILDLDSHDDGIIALHTTLAQCISIPELLVCRVSRLFSTLLLNRKSFSMQHSRNETNILETTECVHLYNFNKTNIQNCRMPATLPIKTRQHSRVRTHENPNNKSFLMFSDIPN